ncbi:hypothetical protein PG996_006092 [Apiospora saccharicola]|uniref:Uncharacterized protein n=1 Tax=Apiospora saccharicola TaxID=335842 RepID=A0ABR1VNB9_9PEZI
MASYQVRLEEERKRLEKKLGQVNQRYDALTRKSQTQAPISSPSTPTSAGQREATPKVLHKSYLQPTTASSNRTKSLCTVNATTAKTTPTRPKLTVSCSSWHFMQHTASSRQKIGKGSTIPPSRQEIPDLWDAKEDTEEVPEEVAEEVAEDSTSEPTAEDLAYKPRPPPMSAQRVELLAEQTRLEDDSWKDPAASYVIIPSDIGYWFLCEAYSIVQEVFHDFCKTHQPLLWLRQFPGGPQEVRFEWSTNNIYCNYWNIPEMSIWGKLGDARLLRNELCHFLGQVYTYAYEGHLEDAQRFAVALSDARRAASLRALRDKLMDVAADTLREVENLGYLAIASKERYWEAHHEKFLQRFEGSYEKGDARLNIKGVEFSSAIELAFQAWIWQKETQASRFEFLKETPDQDPNGQNEE